MKGQAGARRSLACRRQESGARQAALNRTRRSPKKALRGQTPRSSPCRSAATGTCGGTEAPVRCAADMDISEIWKRAQKYQQIFQQQKAAAAAADFPWYPYDTVSNFGVMDQLLKGPNRNLLDLAGGAPVADIGAADGFAAFFLDTLGVTVDIVDYGPTNFNGLRGARLLRETSKANVEVHEVDLDQQFKLPRESYGLVLFLGTLYHLKNPFYALETLARASRHCVLSTRVARFAGPRDLKIDELPVAYLVDPHETNNDATNFWIFSVAGLKRLCHRAGWNVREFITIGDTKKSNPSSQNRDERAFCLLESRNF